MKAIREIFPLTPKGIIEYLNLRRPIYRKTAAYGHFGRNEPEFTWERTDKADELKAFVKRRRVPRSGAGRGACGRSSSLAALGARSRLLLLRVVLWRPLASAGAPPDDGYMRVAGVVHVHTTLSDGGGTPEEVVAAAQRGRPRGSSAITDHNNLDAKPFEGYHDGVLVLVGAEISTPAGHVLGLGIDRDPVFRFSGDRQDALEDVRDLGGVPSRPTRSRPAPDFAGAAGSCPGPWGIELLNGDSEARAAGRRAAADGAASTASTPLRAARRACAARARRCGAGTRCWRGATSPGSRAPTPTAGSRSRRRCALRFPSYESLFALARNHVLLDAPLTGDAAADRAAVLEALRRRPLLRRARRAGAGGRLLLHGRGRPPGERWTMGETVAPARGPARRAPAGACPTGTRLVLLRDGQRSSRRAGRRSTWRCPGPASIAWRPACRAGACPGSSRTRSTSSTTRHARGAARGARPGPARRRRRARARRSASLEGRRPSRRSSIPRRAMDAAVAGPRRGPGRRRRP